MMENNSGTPRVYNAQMMAQQAQALDALQKVHQLEQAMEPDHLNGESQNSAPELAVGHTEGEYDWNVSDSESLQDRLEVIFERTDAQPRRRASMQPSEEQRPMRPRHQRKTTSCFVHSLLSYKSQEGQWTPNAEAELANNKATDKVTETHFDQVDPHTQSRLLTKKQLSDMAFNIRELSKKLGHIRLLLKVRNVFLLTKAHDKKLIAFTRDVSQWLLQQQNSEGYPYTVWVEDTMKDSKIFDAEGLAQMDPSFRDRIKYWNPELCKKKPHLFEIVVALGGDGTVLYSSWLFQRVVPPVMSFALGSLGFLTKFDYDDHKNTLTRAFAEGVTVSLRLRFEGTIMRAQTRDDADTHEGRDLVDELIGEDRDRATTHKPEGTHNILNDIVLDRGPNPTMSTIEVFGDEEHFTTVQADGICVATPTGSTAYNLAAGGSLCHPDNPVILLTAIAPHTLSFRPIILPDTMVLRLGVPYDARASCWASFDGKERCELRPGDYVTISASRFPFPTVLPLDRKKEDWVDSISRTLNWNNRQRQKAFDDAKASKDD